MNEMRSVCVIPGVEAMVHHDLEHWITAFEDRSGKTPTDVVLPAFTTTGASYESQYALPVQKLGENNLLRNWIGTLRADLEGARTWALIHLQLGPLANNMNSLRDQWNQPVYDSCCIINPQVRSMLQTIFREVREIGVDGIAVDITDIFPNSTSSRYPLRKNADSDKQPLQNSCFCRDCLDELSRGGWKDGVSRFTSINGNISRFVLRPLSRRWGGADPLVVQDAWIDKLDGEKLVDFAYTRSFVEIDGPDERQKAIKDAADLLRYMAVRSKVTAQAIKKLRTAAEQESLTMAVLLGSSLYDQSQNVNLSTLLRLSCADEYWAESFEPEHYMPSSNGTDESPALLRVMSARGTYYVNALFEYLDAVTKLKSFDVEDPVLTRFIEAGAALDTRDELSRGQCAQIPQFKGMDGFVGVPFKTADLIDLVKMMATTGSLADSVKNGVLPRMGASGAKLSTDAEPDRQVEDVWA
jgi:hypothetical protein